MAFHYLAQFVFWLINAFRENFAPSIVSFSFLLGVYLGLTPPITLQWMGVLVVSLLVSTNVVVVIMGASVALPLSYLLEPVFDQIGMYILMHIPVLTPFWAWMYHAPLLPFTRFNQTLVMGSTLSFLVLMIPMYFCVRYVFARNAERIDRALTASRFYRTLSHQENLYG